MQIKLSDIDTTQFSVKEGLWNGDKAFLVKPSLQGVDWTPSNLHFRSSIWNESGQLLSGSFWKFTNVGEKPDLFPVPTSLKNSTVVLKLDGSTNIIDYIDGEYHCRSRGTFDAKQIENGHEFYQVFDKYPQVKQWLRENPNYTLITELCTPSNRIVIYYPEVEHYLIGAVNKDNYSFLNQKQLDILADSLLMPRPETYSFNSVAELLESVKLWEGKEGVVWETSAGYLLKVKAVDYLKKHAFKSNLSIKNLLELFLDNPDQTKDEFLNFIESNFDYECRAMSDKIINEIFDAAEQVTNIVFKVMNFVASHRYDARKEFALNAKNNLGEYSGLAFSFLDQKPLDKKTLKKLYYAQLKL